MSDFEENKGFNNQPESNNNGLNASQNNENMNNAAYNAPQNNDGFTIPQNSGSINYGSYSGPQDNGNMNNNNYNGPQNNENMNNAAYNAPQNNGNMNSGAYNIPQNNESMNSSAYNGPQNNGNVNNASYSDPQMSQAQGSGIRRMDRTDANWTGPQQNANQNSQYHYTKENMPSGNGPSNQAPTGGRSRGRKNKEGGGMKNILKIVASALLFGVIAGSTMVGINMAKEALVPSSTSKIQTTDATTEAKKSDKKTTDAEDATSSTESGSTSAGTLNDVSDIVDQVMPSVVSITCTIQTSSYYYGTQESEGAGSGFIIAKDDEKLYIATNNHVVADSTSLTVGFCDGTTAAATVVGTDSDADLAVISVNAADLSEDTASTIKIAVLGDSDAMEVGDPVIAIGNALGYGQSVTTGVVSAKNREISFTDGTMTLLQTDAAINPGNSGGVLCNEKGEVIGINNAKLEDTSVEGMGYAIPMSTAKTILNDLMNATTISEDEAAFLGVVGKNIDSTYSEALGMPSGIYVSQVVTGSPAETAGIAAGDIITGFEGNNVSTMTGLKEKLSRKAAGTKVKITFKRANQNGEYEEQTVEVTLGKKSDFADSTTESTTQQQDQTQQDQNGNSNGNGNGSGDSGNSDGGTYIDPFEYFFGNGSGNSNGGSDGNGYYYYYNN